MKKVTLVWPEWKNRGLHTVSLFHMPPMGLLQLASLTPDNWEVEIIDENTRSIDFDSPTDLVGLSAMTALAPRAYEIAAEYRKRGVPTIIGGIHASTMSEEAIQHVDSVVVGEADDIWATVLDDFNRGSLQKIYHATMPICLDFQIKRPLSKIFPMAISRFLPVHLRCAYIQVQRGCPIGCEFCSVTQFNGARIRSKSIPYIIREIEEERKQGFHFLVLVDDNIVANKKFAKELFAALRGLGIKWVSQTDVRIADDDILDLACDSGLQVVFLGFESISSDTLRSSIAKSKSRWRTKYEDAVKRLHDRGVAIEGSFIFGFDGDNDETIERTIDWAMQHQLEACQFSIATPLPGTKFFADMERAGRLITRDWSRFSATQCVFRPQNWTPEELDERFLYAYKRFYSYASIARRLLRPSLMSLGLIFVNMEFRGMNQ